MSRLELPVPVKWLMHISWPVFLIPRSPKCDRCGAAPVTGDAASTWKGAALKQKGAALKQKGAALNQKGVARKQKGAASKARVVAA
jgi:hypothetical protein